MGPRFDITTIIVQGAHILIMAAFCAVAGIFLLAACLLLVRPAMAHDWYPFICCSDRDCKPLAAVRVTPMVAGGYLVDGAHYVPRQNVRDSMDGRYHGCFPIPSELKCFFAPPRGM